MLSLPTHAYFSAHAIFSGHATNEEEKLSVWKDNYRQADATFHSIFEVMSYMTFSVVKVDELFLNIPRSHCKNGRAR